MNHHEAQEPLWRRFILTEDEKTKQAFFSLIQEKGLKREDLILILKAIRFNETLKL